MAFQHSVSVQQGVMLLHCRQSVQTVHAFGESLHFTHSNVRFSCLNTLAS